MKNNKLKLFLIVFLAAMLFVASSAFAQTGSPGSDLSIQRVYGILVGFLCWLSRVAIMIIVIYLIIYAIMFFLSQGNPGKMTDARKAFLWGIVGIAVIFGTYSIIASVAVFIDPTINYPSLYSWSCSGTNEGGTQPPPGGFPPPPPPGGNPPPPGGNPPQCLDIADGFCDQNCTGQDPDCPSQGLTPVMNGVEPARLSITGNVGQALRILGSNFGVAGFSLYNANGQLVSTHSGSLHRDPASNLDVITYFSWTELAPGTYTVSVRGSARSNSFTVVP